MPVSRAALDVTSRAALRAILAARPDARAVEYPAIVPDQIVSSDPPVLSACEHIEPGADGAVPVHGAEIGFAAFLDGTQRARIPAWVEGVPYVLGSVAAAIRVRRDRRLVAWEETPPAVEHRLYLPLAYLDELPPPEGFEVVDTTAAAGGAAVPTRHPASLLERALQHLQQDRERLEQRFAAGWLSGGSGVLCVDGPMPGLSAVRSSPNVVGIIKSHRTLYADGTALGTVLGLRHRERSPVFVVASRGRDPVASWYLRFRDHGGRAALWGLVRVESALVPDIGARADAVSRWLLAEGSPVALPDSRWDTMTYGIRDCETFLRAIS